MPDERHIAFLGTSRSGLGHLRRIANIARHLRRNAGGLRLTLVTNAHPDGLAKEDLTCFSAIVVCERPEMGAILSRSGVELAVLDTLQLPGIAGYGQKAALILRETPLHCLNDFRRDDGRPWDCVIVPNTEAHWMPQIDRGFAHRVVAAGWILRPTGIRGPQDTRAGVVLATGGGGTPQTRAVLYPMLDRVISDARRHSTNGIQLRQALGPRARDEALPGADEVFDPAGDLNAVFRAADLVISTAGYNSVLELASTDTPAMLVPIPRTLDDQAARVRLWGPRLGFGLLPETIEDAAAWLADQADRLRRRAPVDLGPDGAARAAQILLDMLCPVS